MRRHTNEKAFTLTELLVVIAVLAVLAAIQLPALARTRVQSQRIQCVNNLKQVGVAFRRWAQNHQERYPMWVTSSEGGPAGNWSSLPISMKSVGAFTVFMTMSNELSAPKLTVCPTDDRKASTNWGAGSGADGNVFVPAAPGGNYGNARVSYFIGVDANQFRPQMLLSGDWNWVPNVASQGTFLNGVWGTNVSSSAGWTDKMHRQNGNVLHADGSVQQYTPAEMRDAFRDSGDVNNSIVMPL